MSIPNESFSEKYRLAALEWVDKDSAARMLEETKTAILAQMKSELGEMSDAKAERLVKASKAWNDHLDEIVEKRTEANKAKIHMEYARMRFMEWNNADANRRAEMRMAG